ncbi:hypothetical protein B0H66DRAFT_467120, partial [Apodospora peruviana]
WDEFTYPAIVAGYGHQLENACKEADKIPNAEDIPRSERDIKIEENLNTVNIRWCTRAVRATLKPCAASMREQLGLDKADLSFHKQPFGLKDPMGELFWPDWFIFAQESQIFVVGDSKLSTKWRSAWLDPGTECNPTETDERMWPIRQIATYCQLADTRYGFLITPEELVAVRVHLIFDDVDMTRAGVEYRAIPWNWTGPGLTVNLGLWTLGMMGANDQFKEVAERAHYRLGCLNVWRRATAGDSNITTSDDGESDTSDGGGKKRKRTLDNIDGGSRQQTTARGKLVHNLSGRECDESEVRGWLGESLVIVEADDCSVSTQRRKSPYATPETTTVPDNEQRQEAPKLRKKIRNTYSALVNEARGSPRRSPRNRHGSAK